MASLDDFVGDNYSEDLVSKRAPDGKTVAWFHRESDVDQGEFSMHHTLGQGPYQASPGNHNHDGKNSPYLSPDAFGPGGSGLPGRIGEVETQLSLLSSASPIAPTLTIGNVGITIGYYRVGPFVHLEGQVGNGNGLTISASAQTIFQLPLAYRPPENRAFMVAGNGGTAGKLTVVASSGSVQVQSVVGTPTALYLDGIWYRAA